MGTPRGARRDFAGLEARRFHAARLFARGESQAVVARTLAVTPMTACRWYAAWKVAGRRGLKGAVQRRGLVVIVLYSFSRLPQTHPVSRLSASTRFVGAIS